MLYYSNAAYYDCFIRVISNDVVVSVLSEYFTREFSNRDLDVTDVLNHLIVADIKLLKFGLKYNP